MVLENDQGAINSRAVFTAELRPHRSLGRTGFRLLMGLAFVICFVNVIFFLVTGALPVAMFFGVDFILLYGAFWLNYRAAKARELVDLTPTQLQIRKISPAGRIRESRYNPFWTRFDVERHEEFGITAMAVIGEGHRTTLGNFLDRDSRESFAGAFASALASVKRRI